VIRQRLQRQRVDHAEDRRVGADAEREREDGGEGETGIAPQQARAITNVQQELLELAQEGSDGRRVV
jgi:hypothetical protein